MIFRVNSQFNFLCLFAKKVSTYGVLWGGFPVLQGAGVGRVSCFTKGGCEVLKPCEVLCVLLFRTIFIFHLFTTFAEYGTQREHKQ